jgi:DNA-binding transcriptional MocR family regulator
MWQLDRAGGLPLYKQIIRLLEDAAASGRLAPGSRLPAERRLAGLLGVDRSTVIHALEELTDRNVLIRKRGSGTYVNSEKWGVLHYAQLHWQTPTPLLPRRRRNAFYTEAAAFEEKAAETGEPFFDLSRDELSRDLLPGRAVPGVSWKSAIDAEQNDEASFLGLAAFRRSVRWFLHTTVGLDVPYDRLLITAGSRQAVFLITQCLLRSGDAVGVEAPSYFYSLPVFQAAGLRLFALPMDNEGITPEGLENLATRRPLKMIFLNPVFHNPTGTVMSDRRKQAVLAFCAAKHILVVEDDAYSLLYFDRTTERAPVKTWDSHDQVIYIGSLSSYTDRTMRAGWLVAPPAVIGKLAAARRVMDADLSVLPQILAGEYLDYTAARHLPALRGVLADRASRLCAFLRDAFGDRLTFTPPSGGLYLYARARDTKEKTQNGLLRDFLRLGIVPASGEAFGEQDTSFRFNCSIFKE